MLHILDEISHVYCFWKRARIFFEHFIFFRRKKTNFERFENPWAIVQFEMHSIKKSPHIAIFEKIKIFLRKKTSFFSNDSKFWTFWELLSIITIWDAFQSFFWTFAFSKEFQNFFGKKPISERFENSWAKTQFETDCTSNLAN